MYNRRSPLRVIIQRSGESFQRSRRGPVQRSDRPADVAGGVVHVGRALRRARRGGRAVHRRGGAERARGRLAGARGAGGRAARARPALLAPAPRPLRRRRRPRLRHRARRRRARQDAR